MSVQRRRDICATLCDKKRRRRDRALFGAVFRIVGLGKPTLDLYGYIAGGLYSLSGGEIGNGNERGFRARRTDPVTRGSRDRLLGITGRRDHL